MLQPLPTKSPNPNSEPLSSAPVSFVPQTCRHSSTCLALQEKTIPGACMQASKQEQDRVQAGSPPRPISGRTDSPHRKEEGPTVPPGQPAGRAAGRKRLPPLPLSARGASQGTKSTAAARHAAQPAGNAPKQQQHISSRSEKAPESQRCMPADETVSDDTAAHRSVPDDHSAVPGTRASQHHQQSQQQLAGKVKQAGVPQGAQQGERQGCMGSSGNKMHRSLTISQSEQASVSGTAVPVGAAQAQQQPAPSKGRSSSASLPAHSSPCAVLSSETGASSKASVGSAAERVGTSGVQQSEGGHRGGQQQVARLTASNTALLAELVDLQVCRHFEPQGALLSRDYQCSFSHVSIRGGEAMISMLLSSSQLKACNKLGSCVTDSLMLSNSSNAPLSCHQWGCSEVEHILLIAGCPAHAWQQQ